MKNLTNFFFLLIVNGVVKVTTSNITPHQHQHQEQPEDSHLGDIVMEEEEEEEKYYPPLDASRYLFGSTTSRELLFEEPRCRAVPVPGEGLTTGYLCGGVGNQDHCADYDGPTCNEEYNPYSCTCKKTDDEEEGQQPETSCSFCQVRTANGILCAKAGARITFLGLSREYISCQCDCTPPRNDGGVGRSKLTCFGPDGSPVSTNPSSPVVTPTMPPKANSTATCKAFKAPCRGDKQCCSGVCRRRKLGRGRYSRRRCRRAAD